MRAKKHSIALMIMALGLIYLKAWYIGSTLILLATFLFIKWRSHPYRKLEEKINADAKNYNFPIDQFPRLKRRLIHLYSKFEWSKVKYPFLLGTYEKLIRSYWQRIQKIKQQEWITDLESYIEYWPIPHRALRPVEILAISDAQKEIKRWEIAKAQAYEI